MTFQSYVTAGLLVVAAAAHAAAVEAQSSFAQVNATAGAICQLVVETECTTTTMFLSTSRSAYYMTGQPLERTNVEYFQYLLEDRCEPSVIRRVGARSVLPDSADGVDWFMTRTQMTLEQVLDGNEAVFVNGRPTQRPVALPVVLTVDWAGAGPLVRERERMADWFNGTFSSSARVDRSRAALCTVVGTVGDEIIDTSTTNAFFRSGGSASLYLQLLAAPAQ